MLIELDESNYCTGNYASVGGNPNWIEVNELPCDEKEREKLICYQYIEGEYIFDNKKYSELIFEINRNSLFRLKEYKILQSKQNLEEYINSYKLTSSCHAGIESEYSITAEKQQYLSAMIMTTQMMQQAGIPYQPSWNAAGQECTYDWTLEELTQLAMEIESVVRPLVSQQQAMEVAINACNTQEEVMAIDVTFEDDGVKKNE